MNTIENEVEMNCLAIRRMVAIKTCTLVERGSSCAISTTEIESICSEQNKCKEYLKGNKECIVLKIDKYRIER